MKDMVLTIETGIGQGERVLTRSYGRDRRSSNDRSRLGSRASTNRDMIRCYACREYDHFVRLS